MTTQYVTIQNPLAPGDVLTITVAGAPPVVTPPITDLQAALNATPAGGTLDAGGQAFTGTHYTIPTGVTLANAKLTYTGVAGAAQTGFIDLSANSVLRGCAVVGGPYAAVRPWVGATHATIDTCDISAGAAIGVLGYQCHGLRVTGGRIHNNNTGAGNPGNEAGGIKLGNTSGHLITGVEVDHNIGPGIWEDVSCSGGSIMGNKVHDNTYAGIMSEISTVGAAISGNSVWENGWGDSRISSTALWGGGILLSSTTAAKATGNTIAWCPCGIGAISQKGRASTVKGTTATTNVIAQSKGSPVITYAESGAPTDWGPFTPNSTATTAQLTAAGIPTAPQAGH